MICGDDFDKMRLKVNVKHLGKRKKSIEELYVELDKNPETVGMLIEETVKACLMDYEDRQKFIEINNIFTNQEIDEKAGSGKISFGINYGTGSPRLDDAIDNAKQSFLDGLVVIFINDKQMLNLEEEIQIINETSVTFIRMTMLSGRMW